MDLKTINTIKLVYLQTFLDVWKFEVLVRAKDDFDSLFLTLPYLLFIFPFHHQESHNLRRLSRSKLKVCLESKVDIANSTKNTLHQLSLRM